MKKIKAFICNLAIKYIVWFSKDSSYVKRAKKEFDIAWFNKPSENQEDIEDKMVQHWMCDDVIALLSLLATQGDSGGTIGYKLNLFRKMALFETISPLTFKDDEFSPIHDSLTNSQQNLRNSAVFKKNDKYSYINSFNKQPVFYIGSEEKVEPSKRNYTINGGTFILKENGEVIYMNRDYIKDISKFKADIFTIPVYEVEYPKDWWISFCKESDITEYLESYSFEEDKTHFIKEVFDFKDGEYKDEILKRINLIGTHMYNNPEFKVIY